ncbi:MAG: restriction endonuclease subunit S [Thermomonas sp.]|uniref:restriction endonuclease subunit S n=1 Tax=Thermomonas sp. TaxID=1971895 RepID=UPI0025F3ED44|nr:restriction endonuclease subunit S [Thermomonas sp.]MBK6923737.1 restriction endonuclease subunit S [Thermomonas sp.]
MIGAKAVKFIDFPFAMGADGIKVLKPVDGCDIKYLYHFLRYSKLPDAGYSRHYKFVKELEVPLPPLPEQRRIAAILDKADALRAKRREAIAKLDQLLQSVFLDMFGDPVSNSEGGQWQPSKRHDRSVQTGLWRCSNEGGIFRRGSTDQSMHIDGGKSGCSLNKKIDPKKVVRAGERRSTEGRVAHAASGHIGTMWLRFASTARRRLDSTLSTITRMPFKDRLPCLRSIELAIPRCATVTRKAGRLVNLHTSMIEGLKTIVLPPVEQQKLFACTAERTSTANALQRAAAQTDTLFTSLQHRAFSGTL